MEKCEIWELMLPKRAVRPAVLDAIEKYGPEFAAGFYAGCIDRLRHGLVGNAAGMRDLENRETDTDKKGEC